MPRELLVCGPAGTGKTYGILSVIHCLCRDNHDLRVLLLRANRSDLTESTLVTFEQRVLPADGMSSIAQGVQRNNRQVYRYPSRSEIVVCGLNLQPTKVRSSEWDIIYPNESIELKQSAWEEASSRLERPGRSSRFGWLIGDTNPGWPTHWLKQRCNAGSTQLWNTLHQANPALYDKSGWTPAGTRYVAKLSTLTGHRLQRLRYGNWVSAEGAVYPEFRRETHLIDRFPIPGDWRRIRSIDFGFTNAFVCGWWAIDPDGRMYLYRELYGTKRTVRTWAAKIVALSAGDGEFEETVADHDAEDRATLAECGIDTFPAHKAILRGVDAVQDRLQVAGDGRPRLFFFKDALAGGRDELLVEAGKPTCTTEEIEAYMWAKTSEGRAQKEEPQKLDDHGMDAMRYAVAYVDNVGSQFVVAY